MSMTTLLSSLFVVNLCTSFVFFLISRQNVIIFYVITS